MNFTSTNTLKRKGKNNCFHFPWFFSSTIDTELEESESEVKVKSFSRVRLFATPWTVAHQAPQSMEFFRQEYWIGLPFPSPGDLPDPGIKPGSPALQAAALLSEPLPVNFFWMTRTLKKKKNIKNKTLKVLF